MHLEDMKYLISIIDNKSINKAAKELQLTQPALSTAIGKLEQELGVPLLKRSYKGVVPTEAGDRIYEEAKSILNMIAEWYKLGQCTTVLEGEVHVLAVPTACDFLVKTLISGIRSDFPTLHISLHECYQNVIMQQLMASKMNIGITSVSTFDLKNVLFHVERQGWYADVLHEENRELFLSTKNSFAEKEILEVADLQELTYACYSRSNDRISNQYKGYFNPDYCYYLNNQNNILQLVAEDKAVTIYPPKILGDHILLKSGLVVSRPIQGVATHATYLLLHPSDDMLSLAEREVIKLIRTEFLKINA